MTSPSTSQVPTSPVIQVRAVDTPSPSPDSRSQSTPPPEVKTDNVSGVEDGALELAKQFMSTMGNLARKCQSRGALSELYLTTQASWKLDLERGSDKVEEPLERHFKQVLFAIAHGMKLVRVRDQGRSLFWNRYRDNQGNQLEDERAKYVERQPDLPREYRGDRRGGHGEYRGDRRGYDEYRGDRRVGHGEYRGDRRGGHGEYRGDRRGYDEYQGDRRGGHGEYRGDRRGGQGEYRGDRRGGQSRHSSTPDSKGWIAAAGNSQSHHSNA